MPSCSEPHQRPEVVCSKISCILKESISGGERAVQLKIMQTGHYQITCTTVNTWSTTAEGDHV